MNQINLILVQFYHNNNRNGLSKILEKINADTITLQGDGEISLSIPELAIVNPDKFGIHLLSTSSIDHQVGDSNEKFSIQSISKVFHFQWPYHF